ncbi:hypothetical protein [Pseudoduganella violaceinigra]|uniref:hypothetical protein n=1 Tax=Pseudoduganella violaceinigra TaxID=246602 RepID=UPI0012B50846|nr:hypothetical protein [Pseudoduganella violaceinigra]
MAVKVDHDYRGTSQGQVREFWSRIGEWGPRSPAIDQHILVSEDAAQVSWSPITELDGKVFIDPRRIPSINGVPTAPNGDRELVDIEEVIARGGSAP